jgi:hypothetical protein
MLSPGGSYVFQFAYFPGRTASDSVPESIGGSQMYAKDDMIGLVREAGFAMVRVEGPIELQPFNTDIVWYLCRASNRPML